MAGLWRAAQLMYWRGAAQKVTGAMMCMWWFVGERECGFAQEAWLYCWYTLAVDALLPSSSSANGASWQGRPKLESGEVAALEQADHVALVALRMFQ
jgi:hypothetical protein